MKIFAASENAASASLLICTSRPSPSAPSSASRALTSLRTLARGSSPSASAIAAVRRGASPTPAARAQCRPAAPHRPARPPRAGTRAQKFPRVRNAGETRVGQEHPGIRPDRPTLRPRINRWLLPINRVCRRNAYAYMRRACKREPFDETTRKKGRKKKKEKSSAAAAAAAAAAGAGGAAVGRGRGAVAAGVGVGWGGGRAWQSARERSAPARAMAVESGLDAKWCAPRRARGARCRRRRPFPPSPLPPPSTHTHIRAAAGERALTRAPRCRRLRPARAGTRPSTPPCAASSTAASRARPQVPSSRVRFARCPPSLCRSAQACHLLAPLRPPSQRVPA